MTAMRGGGVVIDFHELADEVKQQAEAQKKAIAKEAQKRLQKFIDELNAQSTKRASALEALGIAPNKGSVNFPFRNARAVVEKKGSVYKVKVVFPSGERNLFNLLDAGYPKMRTPKRSKVMRFPAYKGNLTTPGTLNVGSVQLTGEMIHTKQVGPIPARNFYQALLDWTMKNWNNIRIRHRVKGRYAIGAVTKDKVNLKVVK